MTDATASWQPDPTGRHDHRYWDGSRWTEHVADAGVSATDPYEGTHAPPESTDEAAPAAEAETAAAEPEVGPTDDTPTSGEPTITGPAVDAPTVETPAAEAPTAEAPAVEAPTAEVPTAEAPTAEAPTAEAPAVEEPAEPTAPMAATPMAAATSDEPTAPIDAGASEAIPEPTAEVPLATAPLATEPAGGGGGGSSRSTTRIALAVGAVAVVAIILAVIVLAGGDSGSGSDAKAKLASALETESNLSRKDAACVAAQVVDEIGASRFKDVDPARPPKDLADDLPVAVGKGFVNCHVDTSTAVNGPLGSGTSTSSPLGFDPGEASSFQDLLAHQYETGFHLSKAKADCLAKAMTEAIGSGKVVQGDATSSDFFKDFLDACHVSLDDLDPSTG